MGSLTILFENRMPAVEGWGRGRDGDGVGGGGAALTALQSRLLHMKRLNQTEFPIFVLLCVIYVPRQSFFTFIFFPSLFFFRHFSELP